VFFCGGKKTKNTFAVEKTKKTLRKVKYIIPYFQNFFLSPII
jgi:hypothetical protein